MRALVVMPTFNEAENIASMLPALRTVVPEANILVVDDSSPDGTAEVVRKMMEADVGTLIKDAKLSPEVVKLSNEAFS